jgi:hypothetical protein
MGLTRAAYRRRGSGHLLIEEVRLAGSYRWAIVIPAAVKRRTITPSGLRHRARERHQDGVGFGRQTAVLANGETDSLDERAYTPGKATFGPGDS